MIKKAVIAAILLTCLSARAEFISGNKLLQYMTSNSEVEKATAFGYVAGSFDMGYGSIHCAPDNVTLKQVSDMVKNLIENTPAQRHRSADQFVSAALTAAWPCKKQNQNGRERAT